MKVTVTKKNESVIYNGKIFGHGESFDVDELIGKSLMERGYVSVDAEEATEPEKSMEDMTYAEVKKLAAEHGVAATGKKEELIAKINAAMESENHDPDGMDGDGEVADELPNTDMPE